MIIGADTIVSYEDKILGKPKDEDAAKEMLSMLSGKVHSVYTGVTIVLINKQMRAGIHSFFEKTDVTMYDISQKEIDRYVKTGEPLSVREREIVVCIVKGMSNKQIADTLCISTHTVITHRRNIVAKLQIHSPAGLTIYAIVHKLVDLSEIRDTITEI